MHQIKHNVLIVTKAFSIASVMSHVTQRIVRFNLLTWGA